MYCTQVIAWTILHLHTVKYWITHNIESEGGLWLLCYSYWLSWSDCRQELEIKDWFRKTFILPEHCSLSLIHWPVISDNHKLSKQNNVHHSFSPQQQHMIATVIQRDVLKLEQFKGYTMGRTTTESPEPSGTIWSNEAPTVPLSPHRNKNSGCFLGLTAVLGKCRRDEHYYTRSDECYYAQDWNRDVCSQNERTTANPLRSFNSQAHCCYVCNTLLPQYYYTIFAFCILLCLKLLSGNNIAQIHN